MNSKENKKEVDLMNYWRVIIKRKWVIVSFAGALIFFTTVFSFTVTPMYRSKATLLIEEGTSKILSIDETFGSRSPVVQDLRFYYTQLKLLKSSSLSKRVVRKLNLLSRLDSSKNQKPKRNLISSAKNLLTLKWIIPKKKSKGEKPNFSAPSDPYSSIAGVVQKKLTVKPIRRTKLIELIYTSPSPVLSADIVNTFAEEFISFSIEKRFERTQQASDFLSEQIANLREDLTAKERELQRYGQEKELIFLSDKESTALDKFARLNSAYTQAQIDRIKAEATYREIKDLDVDSLPQSVPNSVIQQLTTEYSRMKNEYEEKSKIFKPSYPEMISLKARLESMKEELKKAVNAAESDYRSALKREYSLKSLVEEQKEAVARMNSSAILYNSLKIEVENIRKQLNSIMEKQKETLISEKLGGLKASNISIIDKAEVPKDPISPKKKQNLLLAILFGIFGGMGLCFILEYLDNSVKGPEDIERLAGLASLGVIPYLNPGGNKRNSPYHFGYKYSYGKENPKNKKVLPNINEIELVNHLYPELGIAEDYRTIRTSILLSQSESPPKTIAFTSSLPKEGKTATVVNMAVSFSQLEEKILVIDADLRRPRLYQIFKTKRAGGLSGYLTGKIDLRDAILKTSIKNIWILPSGPIPVNPAELLNSKKMNQMMEEVKKGFGIVLLDTPPVLAVIDSVIITSLVDSTILIIDPSKLKRKPFLTAIDDLERAKAKITGVVFNGIKMNKGEYFFMDYYRYYRYHYDEEEEVSDNDNNKRKVNNTKQKINDTKQKANNTKQRVNNNKNIKSNKRRVKSKKASELRA